MGYLNVPLADESNVPDDAPNDQLPDPDASWYEFNDRFHDVLDATLSNLGVERYGNVTYQPDPENIHEAKVKLQIGSGEELDLTCARCLNNEIVHYASTLGEGRVETVHENGYVTLVVRGRY